MQKIAFALIIVPFCQSTIVTTTGKPVAIKTAFDLTTTFKYSFRGIRLTDTDLGGQVADQVASRSRRAEIEQIRANMLAVHDQAVKQGHVIQPMLLETFDIVPDDDFAEMKRVATEWIGDVRNLIEHEYIDPKNIPEVTFESVNEQIRDIESILEALRETGVLYVAKYQIPLPWWKSAQLGRLSMRLSEIRADIDRLPKSLNDFWSQV